MFDSFAMPRTVAHQAPLSVAFSRQEHWSGLPFPTPRDPPHPGIELLSPVLQEDSLALNQLFSDGSKKWVKNLPAVQNTQGTRARSLDQEDPLEKEMATHASIVAWKILCTEEPGELQSMGSQRVEQNWATNSSLPLSHQESPYIQVYRIIIND